MCHASEDKEAVVRPLATALGSAGISYWLDEAEIQWGDSITRKVNEGLAMSRFVIVLLSPAFLGKPWPQREFYSALSQESSTGVVRVLPVMIGDAQHEKMVLERYPLITDKFYLRWSKDPQQIIKSLQGVLASSLPTVFPNGSLDQPLQQVVIESFTIDRSMCAYKEFWLDKSKPYWPEDINAISVTYYPDGRIGRYEKVFSSREEAEEYGETLDQKYNHHSFYEGASHSLWLRRVGNGLDINPANLPIFYVSISNHSSRHVVMTAIRAPVHKSKPLASIGESHTLSSLAMYEVELGRSCPCIPSLKIEAGDAAAFHVVLKPQNTRRWGDHLCEVSFVFVFADDSISSDRFVVVM